MYKKLHRFFLDREEAGLWVPEINDSEGDEDEQDEDADSDSEAEIEIISIASDADDTESDKENRPEATDEAIKYNYRQIRCKITTLIGDEGIRIDDFIDTLNIPPNSFHSLMKQSGPHASVRNQTYKAAYRFFVDSGATKALQKPTGTEGKAKTAPTTNLRAVNSQSQTNETQQKRAAASNKKTPTATPSSILDVKVTAAPSNLYSPRRSCARRATWRVTLPRSSIRHICTLRSWN